MTTPHGRLMLTVLGGLAEFERELIRTRTGQGPRASEGALRETPAHPEAYSHQQQEARARRDKGEALTEIARSYNVSHSTISRLRP